MCRLIILILVLVPGALRLGPPLLGATASPKDFDQAVAPFLREHCNRCHDQKTQKGDFRLDTLSTKVGFENTPQWIEIMERINSGEMPPKKEKVKPTAAERKLRYKGQLDDSRYADAATVQSQDARNAVEALLAGKAVPVEVTKPHGCSTKWMTKKSMVAEKLEKWNRTPVDVELIDAPGAATLRKNGTKKFRLFNIWATWCGPCVAEFPELVTTARKFGLRDFELITISLNDPKEVGEVKEFLEKRGAGLLDKLKPTLVAEGRKSNSYVYSGRKPEDMMNALDPEWPGAIPHSLLVAPNGEIVWRHNGPVDGDELRAKVLEVMGPYYQP